MSVVSSYYISPIGIIEVLAERDFLVAVNFCETEGKSSSSSLLTEAMSQLEEYFQGQRRKFSLPIKLEGTGFQQQLWNILPEIPYGKTTTYRNLSNVMKRPDAYRAVGNANSKNKFLIVLPCHRVVGKNGDMVGYAGGIWRKQWLLGHEEKIALASGVPTVFI